MVAEAIVVLRDVKWGVLFSLLASGREVGSGQWLSPVRGRW